MSEESGGRAQGRVTPGGRPAAFAVDGARSMEMLVFDVGMNVGMDTAYYLSKGCRVIAVEANPVLCEQARHRFANALRSGQLVIESVGIADEAGTATFYVNERNSEFSAFDLRPASRGGAYHAIQVPTVRFRDLLAKHGVPHYLKIDIEGYDGRCLEALQPGRLPKYVSVEAHELDYLLKLWCLGYRKFKVIDQMRHNSTLPLFSNENPLSRASKLACWYLDRVRNKWGKGLRYASPSSGPFGEDTPGDWRSLEDVAYDWLHLRRGHRRRGTLNHRSWFDFHAKCDA